MKGRQILALMSLTWVVSQPRIAEACSCFAMPGISTSVPWIGDTDVPLNVVPWVIAGSAVELHDEQGKVVPAEVRVVSPVGFSC